MVSIARARVGSWRYKTVTVWMENGHSRAWARYGFLRFRDVLAGFLAHLQRYQYLVFFFNSTMML